MTSGGQQQCPRCSTSFMKRLTARLCTRPQLHSQRDRGLGLPRLRGAPALALCGSRAREQARNRTSRGLVEGSPCPSTEINSAIAGMTWWEPKPQDMNAVHLRRGAAAIRPATKEGPSPHTGPSQSSTTLSGAGSIRGSSDLFVSVLGDWAENNASTPVKKTSLLGGSKGEALYTVTAGEPGRFYLGGSTLSPDGPGNCAPGAETGAHRGPTPSDWPAGSSRRCSR